MRTLSWGVRTLHSCSERCPGNYVMIGNGQGQMVHHPQFVFNQELLPLGAAYWVSLVDDYLNNC